MKWIFSFAIVLASISITAGSVAEVYKWVDADGKVHFSDKPQDAERGQQVDVDSVNVMEGGDELAASASQNRERVLEQQKRAAKAAEEAKNAPNPCEADLARYKRLTGIHHDANGRPFYYYMNNDDGSPMSETEHRQRIKEMGENLRKRGCL